MNNVYVRHPTPNFADSVLFYKVFPRVMEGKHPNRVVAVIPANISLQDFPLGVDSAELNIFPLIFIDIK